MKIVISAESTVDLSKELLKKYNIKTIPFSILLGEENLLDGEIKTEELIDYVNKTKILPKTGAVNEESFNEHFSALLKEYESVIHFSLSSEMSSAYNNAVRASKNFDGKVFVVDTRTLSTGIALLCIYAKELVDEGLTAEEIFNKANERVSKIQASFVLNRLDYLYKGGRCSCLTYFGANILKIRPQIIVKNGKMISGRKFRGAFNYVVDGYCKAVLEENAMPDLSVAFVTYTTAEKQVIESAYNHLKNVGFKEIYVTQAGGTITSHCGENCLGILFANS